MLVQSATANIAAFNKTKKSSEKRAERKDCYASIVKPTVCTTFPVAVVENEQAMRCGLAGLYELHINETEMALHNLSNKEQLYSWPYRYIRRYGRTSKNFQFEAGRKCLSGAGLFSLITEEGLGSEIFTQVTKRFDEIRNKMSALTPSSSFDEEGSDEDINSPQLPPRKYKQGTLKSLFQKVKSRKTAEVTVQLESPPTSPPAKPRRAQQDTSYEEIMFQDEETPAPPRTKSPSFVNHLIEEQRRKHRGKHSTSSSSCSSDDGQPDDAVYNVLSGDAVNSKLTLVENYSRVS